MKWHKFHNTYIHSKFTFKIKCNKISISPKTYSIYFSNYIINSKQEVIQRKNNNVIYITNEIQIVKLLYGRGQSVSRQMSTNIRSTMECCWHSGGRVLLMRIIYGFGRFLQERWNKIKAQNVWLSFSTVFDYFSE